MTQPLTNFGMANDMKCGPGSMLQPWVTTKDAFNPCFLTTVIAIVFGAFTVGCGTDLIKLSQNKQFGSLRARSTGLWHYIRVAAVVVKILLVLKLARMSGENGEYVGAKRHAYAWSVVCLAGTVLPLHLVETGRSAIQRDWLLAFWPVVLILESVQLFQDANTPWQLIGVANTVGWEVVSIVITVGIAILELSKRCWKPTHELVLHYKTTNAKKLLRPNLYEKFTYSNITPIITHTYKSQGIADIDLPTAPENLTTAACSETLATTLKKFGTKSLPKAMMISFGGIIFTTFMFEFGNHLLNFVQPQLLRSLINYFNEKMEDEETPALPAIAVCFSMFLVTILQTYLSNQFMLKVAEVGLSFRSSLTSLIYQKSLKLSVESKTKYSSGDVMTIISVDVNRIQEAVQNLSLTVLAPLDLVLALTSLWRLLGSASLTAFVSLLVLIPINSVIIKVTRRYNVKQMSLKDERSKLITEVLFSIKSIKLFSWEIPMLDRVNECRNDRELVNQRKIRLLSLLGHFIWNSIPFIIPLISFSTYALTRKNGLTSDIVFPALALFNLLSAPLVFLPMGITSALESYVALKRISAFLETPEIDSDLVQRHLTSDDNDTIEVQNATFLWLRSSNQENSPDNSEITGGKVALQNINFTAPKGSLSCIVGEVGSGKSAFLYSLLGNLETIESNASSTRPLKLSLLGNVAYCSQNSWILNASVKDNILFGYEYNPEVYEMCLEACQLLPDLKMLPDGDETHVGEKGITLSGGQKARLSLARAVYSRADILLLDDVLSAVDSHVGKLLIDRLFSRVTGVLRNKAVVLATNSIPVLKNADQIYLLEMGVIIEEGTFQEVSNLNSESKLSKLIHKFGSHLHLNSPLNATDDSSSSSTPVPASRTSFRALKDVAEGDAAFHTFSDPAILEKERRMAPFKSSTLEKMASNLHTGQSIETSAKGKVKASVYYDYAKYCSITGVFIWICLLLLSNFTSVLGNYWLKHWAESDSNEGANNSVWKFISIYAMLGLGSCVLSSLQVMTLLIFLSYNASKKIHNKMMNSVIKTRMSFFERTPTGRIMNRFTSDINGVDEVLPRFINVFFVSATKTLFNFGVIGFAVPGFLLVSVLLLILYFHYRKYYVSISRDLKRIISVSRSPIYGHFQESLNGADTIRAYQLLNRFGEMNNANVDANIKCLLLGRSVNRWLNARLQFIGSIVILTSGLLLVFSFSSNKPISAGMAGLVMTYSLQVTESLSAVVRTSAEVEANIVCVERCLEYCKLPSEEKDDLILVKPSEDWPVSGSVKFQNYSTRYKDDLNFVLKNLSFEVRPGEKVGVVGRTGAGKSTLTLALFRIIEAAQGCIDIDGMRTSSISLYDLRPRLSIIPQDPQIFEGTIRENLDPFGNYDDTEIWAALEKAHLKHHIEILESEDGNKLNYKINEGGSNFSSGQRQLICLARILLKTSKILVLDEATAAVDVETDQIVQETIRKSCKDNTIITIAHRLNTVLDSDRILVLDQGEIKEFDSPQNLLNNTSSMFHSLCKQGGLVQE